MAVASNRNTDNVPTYFVNTNLQFEGSSSVLKTTTGNIYTFSFTKGGTGGVAYVKFYDSATVTHGTTDPVVIVRESAANNGFIVVSKLGIPFSTGVCIAASSAAGTGAADAEANPADAIQITVVGD